MTWQPIETAPRDEDAFGDVILVYVPSAKSRKVQFAAVGDSVPDCYKQRYGWNFFNTHGNGIRATHWQPLPPPPEAA